MRVRRAQELGLPATGFRNCHGLFTRGSPGKWGPCGWSVGRLDHNKQLVIGPTKVHVGDKEIIDVLWKGELKCIGPKAKDVDLWLRMLEEVHFLPCKDMLIVAEHVKAHRTEKERQRMSLFEKFITEGT